MQKFLLCYSFVLHSYLKKLLALSPQLLKQSYIFTKFSKKTDNEGPWNKLQSQEGWQY